jgi:hypothetical protein
VNLAEPISKCCLGFSLHRHFFDSKKDLIDENSSVVVNTAKLTLFESPERNARRDKALTAGRRRISLQFAVAASVRQGSWPPWCVEGSMSSVLSCLCPVDSHLAAACMSLHFSRSFSRKCRFSEFEVSQFLGNHTPVVVSD